VEPTQQTHRTPPEAAGLGVYVHFPWCLKKCPYCDFLSVAAERPEIPHAAYASQISAELARRATETGPRKLASVFFGGGTPSLWEPRELGRVLAAIRAHFPGDDPEVTVECNPTSFDEERARALMDAGVGRVSIGVQGLDDERLRFLGRLHDVAGGLEAVRAAVRAGVARVSADLIFGVAGQNSREAADEAHRVAELGVTHLSAYALTIEPGTLFGALAKKGRLPLLGDDQVAESFLRVDETLSALGFEHYEISNFAHGGDFAEHNVGYWRGRDYLGLGAGAWGTLSLPDGRVRYRNTPSPERYLETDWATIDPASAASELEPLSPETSLAERILLGLRMADGVDLGQAARETGAAAWTAERERVAERLVARGRLARDGDRIWIPREAWLFADGTISELL
jgi:oxygen-independent coproporphyrinogen-3 oxidase